MTDLPLDNFKGAGGWVGVNKVVIGIFSEVQREGGGGVNNKFDIEKGLRIEGGL